MRHYRLTIRHRNLARFNPVEWIFLAPSDSAAALTGPYRCTVDAWPDGTEWEVSRYDTLIVDHNGATVTPACVSNVVGSGTFDRRVVSS